MWTDSGAGLVDHVLDVFNAWLDSKSEGQFGSPDAEIRIADRAMRFRRTVKTSDAPDAPVRCALRGSLIENFDNGSRWTTTVRAWEGPAAAADPDSSGGWIWVDLDAVTYDAFENVTVAAPRFVRDLLDQGTAPNRVGVPLRSTPTLFEGVDGAERLAGLVTNVDRDVPIVVFAPLPDTFYFDHLPPGTTVAQRFADAVEGAARMTAGLTAVCQLDQVACRRFKQAVNEHYEVRDGAFRIYLPGVDPALDEGWKHRYTVPVRFLGRPDLAGQMINRAISIRSGTRRAPASYEEASRLLDVPGTEHELYEYIEFVEAAAAESQRQWADLDRKYQDAIDEYQRLEEENNRLRRQLNTAHRQLAQTAVRPDEPDLPETADSPSEAALLAQLYLADRLSFPAEACQDLADLDASVEARAWGATSWRAFLALHAYGGALAAGEKPGTFWTWCLNSGSAYAWPANSKKLAMKESDSVRTNKQLNAKRVFPVDTSLEKSGRLYMEAHIKIAEGGGRLSPRIYFHVDKAKVYIGYFGPHKNVPNTLK
jgi:regulator of replication initiation timing